MKKFIYQIDEHRLIYLEAEEAEGHKLIMQLQGEGYHIREVTDPNELLEALLNKEPFPGQENRADS